MKIGIVGLPNVGKSTLFNALTRSDVPAENFPFTTIDRHVGVVPVPDERLTKLAEIVEPARVVPAVVQFVDIAGLIGGAHKGEGLGNRFLGHIREADALALVIRAFRDTEVHHVSGELDPARDIEVIGTELALADLETVGRRRAELEPKSKTDPAPDPGLELLRRIEDALAQGEPVRSLALSDQELSYLKALSLLTAKPVIYVANVDEVPDPSLVTPIREAADREGAPVVLISAKLEAELNELSDGEKRDYLRSLGQERTGLEELIRTGYRTLGLQTFFTAGPKEVRAWTVREGVTAPRAAGVIHSDFEKHFIRAEVISYQDFIAHGGEAASRTAGKLRSEGRDYAVRDGDVIHFRTSA